MSYPKQGSDIVEQFCCVCGKIGADAYCETADGNFVYFHKECLGMSCPRKRKRRFGGSYDKC